MRFLKPLLVLSCAIGLSASSFARTIGPDPFGYTASDETTFQWIGLAPAEGGSGASQIRQEDWTDESDDGYVEVPIGFNFQFYGNTKTNVFITSNGLLTFDTATTEYDSECIPTLDDISTFIAPFWDDVDPSEANTNLIQDQGVVFYQTIGNSPTQRFVAEYYRVPHNDDTNAQLTFEVILHENGDIKMQYLTLANGYSNYADGRSATVGIEDNSQWRGVEWWCGDDTVPGPLSNGVPILFTYPGDPRILVLQETCGGSTQFVFEALNNLGPEYAYKATMDEDYFLDRLQNGGPWDLIIIDEYSDCLNATLITELGNYIAGGGKVIIDFFGWSTGECGQSGPLPALFDATYASEYSAPTNLYRWTVSHPIFTTPNAVPDFTNTFCDSCARDGAKFDPTGGGTSIAGYVVSPQTAGEHGLIIGNGGRTILNGEVMSVLCGDRDGDGKPDAVELIENEVLFLLEQLHDFTTAASPAEHGTPVPFGYGVTQVVDGSVFTCSVASPADVTTNTRYVCTGFVGSGSVPASGATNRVAITLDDDSILTWQWRTEHKLTLTAVNGTIGGATAGFKPEGFAYDLVPTASANYYFSRWTVNGASAGSAIPLHVVMDGPKAVVAIFTSAFKNVTGQTTTEFLTWRLNRQTGTLFGDMRLCNNEGSGLSLIGPFWYEVQRTTNYYLMHPTGTNAFTGRPYVDITAQVQSQLGGGSLEPGECVMVTNLEFYFRTRVPVVGFVYGMWADPPGSSTFVESLADTDGDGIANGAEDRLGLNKNNPFDGLDDPDGDRMSNVEEYRAGTDLRDGQSYLGLKNMRPRDGHVQLEWIGGTGVTQYLLWSRYITNNDPWLVLYTNRPPMGRTNVLEVNPPEQPAGFYRIRTR